MEKQCNKRSMGSTTPTSMKQLYFISLLLLLAGSQAHAIDTPQDQWGPINCSVRMSIKLHSDNKNIHVGQAFRLSVRLENMSTNKNFVSNYSLRTSGDPYNGLSCTVTSPSGKDVSPKPTTDFGGGSAKLIAAPPGHTAKFEFDLSELCKFNEVGNYKIVGKKKILFLPNTYCEIVSNPLYIAVVAEIPASETAPATNQIPAIKQPNLPPRPNPKTNDVPK